MLADPGPAELQTSMFQQRVVFLRGRLDAAAAGEVAMQLMALDAMGDEPVSLYLDSREGALDAAFLLIDTIDLIGVPVHATCAGRAEGPAVGVLAVADIRRAGRNASFRLCSPIVSADGASATVEDQARRHVADLDRFVRRLAAATGRPLEQVEADVERGRYLDAEQALAYGLIDELLASRPSR